MEQEERTFSRIDRDPVPRLFRGYKEVLRVKVLLSHADEGGCGFYRMLSPGRVLQERGADVTFDLMGSSLRARLGPDGHIRSVAPVDYDVVVFQRPMSKHSHEYIGHLQAQGVAVVVELDDDFWHMDRGSSLFREFQPRPGSLANWDYLAASCKAADLVTVSTPALARVVPSLHVRVLRNLVPEAYLHVQGDLGDNADLAKGLIVGWSGVPDTHAGDLREAGNGVVRAVRAAEASFVGLGSPDTGPFLGFEQGEALFSPWVDLASYPEAVAAYDIGIVPLKMSLFNEAKSYLKGLEYAALGLPFVASPTSEYRYLASLGAGEIAKHKHDWERLLTRLLTDVAYRKQRREDGRAVAESLTYERHGEKWMDAWEHAVKLRKFSSR